MVNGRIGVVTVTYNSESVLPDFLRCLRAQTYTEFLLFVVDNSSKDNTLEVLRSSKDDRFTIIANASNLGVAEGNNQGIKAALDAGCSSVLLINNDTEFGETLILDLIDGLNLYGCDMTCPKMLYFDEPDRIWAAGGFFQPRLGYRALHFGLDQIDHGQFSQARPVTYVPTCCVLIRSELFGKIGLMDPKYFVYADDTDFMYRALTSGASLYYLPHIRLLHKVGRLTGGDTSAFSIKYSSRNFTYFQLKHLRRRTAILWISLRRLHYIVKFLLHKETFATLRLRLCATQEAFEMAAERHQASVNRGLFRAQHH